MALTKSRLSVSPGSVSFLLALGLLAGRAWEELGGGGAQRLDAHLQTHTRSVTTGCVRLRPVVLSAAAVAVISCSLDAHAAAVDLRPEEQQHHAARSHSEAVDHQREVGRHLLTG